jgi:hypothetical protein
MKCRDAEFSFTLRCDSRQNEPELGGEREPTSGVLEHGLIPT